jgi:hypothetical protein
MNIRSLFLIFLASFPVIESHAQISQKPNAPRPNVLLIATDDLNDWVRGHPQT